MIRVVPYEPSHLNQITPKECFQGDGYRDRIRSLSELPTVRLETIFYNDEPVAILGLGILWNGVGEVFSVISPSVSRIPVSFHKTVLMLLRTYEDTLELHRVQMTVRAGHPENIRWAESLGFDPDGLLHKYGPDGSDHWMMSRCKWGR